MKSIIVHLKNKYPDSEVSFSGERIAVKKDGELIVCLMKGAHGTFECAKDLGARDAFCLSPIPRDCCGWKLSKDNKIEKHSDYSSRSEKGKKYCKSNSCVPCEHDIKEGKYKKEEQSRFS